MSATSAAKVTHANSAARLPVSALNKINQEKKNEGKNKNKKVEKTKNLRTIPKSHDKGEREVREGMFTQRAGQRQNNLKL